MENIDIQGRAFVIKWIKLFPSKYTSDPDLEFIELSWQLKALKETTGFGVYKVHSSSSGLVSAPGSPSTPLTPFANKQAGSGSPISDYTQSTTASSTGNQGNQGNLEKRLKLNGLVELKRYGSWFQKNQVFSDSLVIGNPAYQSGHGRDKGEGEGAVEPLYIAFVLNNEQHGKKNRVLFSYSVTPFSSGETQPAFGEKNEGFRVGSTSLNEVFKTQPPPASPASLLSSGNSSGNNSAVSLNSAASAEIRSAVTTNNKSTGNGIANGMTKMNASSSSFNLRGQAEVESPNRQDSVALSPLEDSSKVFKKEMAKPQRAISNASTTASFASTSSTSTKQLQNSTEPYSTHNGRFFQGYLLKKRRKKLQGFTKRFFKIDYRDGTLAYYTNERSQGVSRGEVVVKLCVISADKSKRLIVLDSGLEVWHIRAYNTADWKTWCEALSRASTAASSFSSSASSTRQYSVSSSLSTSQQRLKSMTLLENNQTRATLKNQDRGDSETETELDSVSENEVKIQMKDLEGILQKLSLLDEKVDGLAEVQDKSHRQKVVSQVRQLNHEIRSSVSKILDFRVSDLKKSKAGISKLGNKLGLSGRHLSPVHTDEVSSILSAEYFDAVDDIPGVILINPDEPELLDNVIDGDVTSTVSPTVRNKQQALAKDIPLVLDPKDMWPVTGESKETATPVKRRNDVPESKTQPPTLLSFLRKNVGKDLGSISMPVSSNEPVTILQYMAETFEYAALLNDCSKLLFSPESSSEASAVKRLALVTAFAISNLSLQRNKVRCTRKPFSPLLGESYELCREDLGFRFLAEKVEHKPEQVFAMHVDSVFQWEVDYTLIPSQKFWGKSVELNNIGVFSLKFSEKSSGKVVETYEWSAPTTVLKNIIAGEKFIEPTGLFEVHCLETGLKSSCDFKSTGGFFKGRCETVTCELFSGASTSSAKSSGKSKVKVGEIQGTWTEKLVLMPSNTVVWQCGELVSNPTKKYGFTTFSSNLNEITALEKSQLPPSDSRYRPDMREYEAGNVDVAETLKQKLEQKQRDRRTNKQNVVPHFFERVSASSSSSLTNSVSAGENARAHHPQWRIIQGSKNYWNRRKLGYWDDIDRLW